MEKKLKNWVEQSIPEIKAPGDVKDIHIDELLGFELKSKEEFLMQSYEILKKLQLIAENFDLSNFRLDLNIKLEESEHSTGRPKNIKEIIESIDSFSMPEVLIYRPDKGNIFWKQSGSDHYEPVFDNIYNYLKKLF